MNEQYDARNRIDQTKWYLSEKAGHDIGVPGTIDYLLQVYLNTEQIPEQQRSGPEEDLIHELHATRESLIERYFIDGLPVEIQRKLIQGELQRYNCLHHRSEGNETRINPVHLCEWANENHISHNLASRLARVIDVPFK